MATLTEISVYTRKMVIWIGIGLVAFLLLRFLFTAFINSYKAAHPPKAPAPDVRFGEIAPIAFPEDTVYSKGLTFMLLRIEGKPSEATGTAKVYFMPKKLPSLLAPQKARDFAASIGFTAEPQILSSSMYHFTDPLESNRTLELDILNRNFQLSYDLQKDTSIFTTGVLPTNEEAINAAKSFVTFDNSLLSISPVINLLGFDGKELVPVDNFSQAQALQINFFRKDYEDFSYLTPQFNKSFNYIIVTGNSDPKKKILEASYAFWPMAYDNYSTYPLRTENAAWNELLDGRGIVATMGRNKKTDQIVIRKIYLAYYDSGEDESYMQPIFVFEGDYGFAAYVPAIDPTWLQ